MDGVIVDTNAFHKTAIQQFCRKYGFELSEEQLRTSVYGRTNKDWITNLFGTISEEQAPTPMQRKKSNSSVICMRPHITPVKGLVGFLHRLVEAQYSTRNCDLGAPRER
jgi:beta-phosphoglucomutase